MKLTQEKLMQIIKEEMQDMNEMGVTSDNLGAASHMSGLDQEFAEIVKKMMGPYLSAAGMINIINRIDNEGSITQMPSMQETKTKK